MKIVDCRFQIAECRLKHGKYKSQNPNNKQITMTEIQNSKLHIILKKEKPKYVWVIEYWNLRFICNLVLEIWDFGMQIEKSEIMFESSSTSKR